MVGVFCFIFVVCFFLFVAARKEDEASASVVCFLICLIIIAVLKYKVSLEDVYEQEIAMYQEENKKIEKSIEEVVNAYMEEEKVIFSDFKYENSVTLTAIIPDLKSDKLVQRQIEVFLENSEEIKSLKKKKRNTQKYKWWINFNLW